MRVIDSLVTESEDCAYLPGRLASLEFRLILDMTPVQLERYLERGWRRFGVAYFRPACGGCRECVSLRIPVDRFRPNRGQRRTLSRGARLRLEIGRPVVDDVRLDLYHRWHRSRAELRGWRREQMDADRYFMEFAYPHAAARELTWYDDDTPRSRGPRLVAVTLADETPTAISAVYTFHDPDYDRLSLGTLSILHQIRYAAANGKSRVYLGYRVLGCPSSEYKDRFRPHELLRGWPDLDTEPRWVAGDAAGDGDDRVTRPDRPEP